MRIQVGLWLAQAEPASQLYDSTLLDTFHAGDKLRVCGAELVANGQSEVLESAMTSHIRVSFNGTHR